MTYEVFKDRRLARRKPRGKRNAEFRELFGSLSQDPENLVAKIDASPTLALNYARRMGYRVCTRKITETSCYVWLIKEEE